jgi:outer membrane receptor protein involved in Fe transport
MEASGKPLRELTITASVAVQRAHDALSHAFLTNSPGMVAKLRGALPLAKNKLLAAAAMQYLSPRRTLAYAEVPSYWLADLTLTTNRFHPDFDVQFGVRNLFNRAYYDPVGSGAPEDRLLQDGRSIFLKLIWRTKE